MGRSIFVWSGGGALEISNNVLPCLTSIYKYLSPIPESGRGHYQKNTRSIFPSIKESRISSKGSLNNEKDK